MNEQLTAQIIVERTHDIVSLPSIYFRLKEIVDDVSTSNRSVGQLISEDTGLTARLMRIANSSFYGAPSKIDTVTRAITVIGTRQVSDIVLSTSVIDMFNDIPEERENMTSFWRHSIRCAVMARILATYRREPNIERFFVAGLLHDIGRLIMLMQLGKAYWDVIRYARQQQLLLDVAERKVLGFDHSAVGGLLLKKWELPTNMVEAARYHCSPGKCNYNSLDASMMHIADVVSCSMQVTEGQDVIIPPVDEKAWSMLSLPVSILPPGIAQLHRQFEDAVQLIYPDNIENRDGCLEA